AVVDVQAVALDGEHRAGAAQHPGVERRDERHAAGDQGQVEVVRVHERGLYRGRLRGDAAQAPRRYSPPVSRRSRRPSAAPKPLFPPCTCVGSGGVKGTGSVSTLRPCLRASAPTFAMTSALMRWSPLLSDLGRISSIV